MVKSKTTAGVFLGIKTVTSKDNRVFHFVHCAPFDSQYNVYEPIMSSLTEEEYTKLKDISPLSDVCISYNEINFKKYLVDIEAI